MFDQSGAAFHPVAVIIVSDVAELPRLSGMDVSADDAVHALYMCRARDRCKPVANLARGLVQPRARFGDKTRSEEHTSELQSLMRNSYAVFCLKKKIITQFSHIFCLTKYRPTHHI